MSNLGVEYYNLICFLYQYRHFFYKNVKLEKTYTVLYLFSLWFWRIMS